MAGAASTTATVAYDPDGTGRPAGAVEVHQLVLAGAPGEHRGVPLGGTLDQYLLHPADAAWWRTSADRSTTVRSRSNRSATTSAGTNRSVMAAARVPGRGEKMNVYALS